MTEAMQRDMRSRTEPLIHAVRAHEQGAREWSFSGIAARMNRLYDQLNNDFFMGKLPKALISIGPDLIMRYGYYQVGRDGIGAKHRIHLNSRHFGRSESDVGVTLLHEMIHVYQHLFGHVGHRHRYHNREFVDIAGALGFESQVGSGVTKQVSGWLLTKLDQLGFSAFDNMLPDQRAEPIRKPLRKVMWKCICGQEVWVGKGECLEVVCKICHAAFERPEELMDSKEEIDLAVAAAA